jgi:hypothetical protein
LLDRRAIRHFEISPRKLWDERNTFRGPTPDELGKMMTDHFLPANNVVLDQNVLVINTRACRPYRRHLDVLRRLGLYGVLGENFGQRTQRFSACPVTLPLAQQADTVGLILDDASGCGLSTRVAPDAEEAYFVVHHSCATITISLARPSYHRLFRQHRPN